jgi:hypothetical protein
VGSDVVKYVRHVGRQLRYTQHLFFYFEEKQGTERTKFFQNKNKVSREIQKKHRLRS